MNIKSESDNKQGDEFNLSNALNDTNKLTESGIAPTFSIGTTDTTLSFSNTEVTTENKLETSDSSFNITNTTPTQVFGNTTENLKSFSSQKPSNPFKSLKTLNSKTKLTIPFYSLNDQTKSLYPLLCSNLTLQKQQMIDQVRSFFLF